LTLQTGHAILKTMLVTMLDDIYLLMLKNMRATCIILKLWLSYKMR